MRVIGAEDQAAALWRDMSNIDQAHLRAGQRVRGLLNRQILKGDTRELERRGWQDYDVAEIEGEGALSVARVEARGPETVTVELDGLVSSCLWRVICGKDDPGRDRPEHPEPWRARRIPAVGV